MGGRLRGARSRNFLSIADQVCSSASNFLLMLLVARSAASASTFGTFTVAFAVLTFALTVSRSVLGVPVGTDLHHLDGERTRAFIGRTVACALALGVAVSTVLAVADAAMPGLAQDVRVGVLVLAVAAPVVLIQDVGRYVAVATQRPMTALGSDLSWLAVLLVVLGVDLVSKWEPSISWALALWGLGGVLALTMVSRLLVPPLFRKLVGWIGRDARRAHLLIDSVMAAGVPLLIAVSVTAFASAAVLGSLRGASTLLSPLNIAITSVGLALIPEAARRDGRGARRVMAWASGLLVVVTVLWALALLVLPDQMGTDLLGTIWSPAVHVLPVAALEYLGLAAWTGAGSFFRARGQTLSLLRFRYVYSGLSVAAALSATWIWGTPRAIAGATAAGAICVGVASWVHIIRHRERVPEPAPSR